VMIDAYVLNRIAQTHFPLNDWDSITDRTKAQLPYGRKLEIWTKKQPRRSRYIQALPCKFCWPRRISAVLLSKRFGSNATNCLTWFSTASPHLEHKSKASTLLMVDGTCMSH
jgi:hypothetical protein